MRVWEVATNSEVLRLGGHTGPQYGENEVSFGADSRTLLTCGRDAQAYLWSLRPATTATDKPALEMLWSALADEPKRAYVAIWQLTEAEGVPAFLRGKITPVKPVADERLRKLIADLASAKFAVREAATKALADLQEIPLPAMRKALENNPTLEMRKRLEALVDRVETKKPTAEELRIGRAIDVLERQGTAEARRLLKGLAAGVPEALPTTAAKSALKRLER